MAYVSRMIAPGETLIGVSRLHWIHVMQGFLWLVGLMACGFLLDAALANFLGFLMPSVSWGFMALQTTWLELFFLGAGLYIFSIYFIHFATTEVALTNQRIMHKTGWVFINVKEVNLDEIKGSHIDLGLLGRFLGYGSIALDARFVKDAQLPFINKPYRFVTAMNEAQTNIEDHFSLVLDEGHEKKVRLDHRKQPIDPQAGSRAGTQTVSDAEEAVNASAESPAQKGHSPVQLVVNDKGAAITPKQNMPQNEGERPHAAAHQVAEGSYEEEKLKEELSREWEDSSEEDPDTHPASSRSLH